MSSRAIVKTTCTVIPNKIDFARAVVSYIIISDATIRETAKVFNCSKSKIGEVVRSSYVPTELRTDIDSIMQAHIAVRHIRGGESTKKKYAALRAAAAAKK